MTIFNSKLSNYQRVDFGYGLFFLFFDISDRPSRWARLNLAVSKDQIKLAPDGIRNGCREWNGWSTCQVVSNNTIVRLAMRLFVETVVQLLLTCLQWGSQNSTAGLQHHWWLVMSRHNSHYCTVNHTRRHKHGHTDRKHIFQSQQVGDHDGRTWWVEVSQNDDYYMILWCGNFPITWFQVNQSLASHIIGSGEMCNRKLPNHLRPFGGQKPIDSTASRLSSLALSQARDHGMISNTGPDRIFNFLSTVLAKKIHRIWIETSGADKYILHLVGGLEHF